jgi:sulfate permease, SulP family
VSDEAPRASANPERRGVKRYANVELPPSARVTPGVVVYRLDDRLFFANARYVKGRVREAVRGAPDPSRWLVFDAESVTHVDATGVEALRELTAELRRDGVDVVVARMRSHVHDAMTDAGVVESIGEGRFFPTVRTAVAFCVEQDSASVADPAVGSSS